MGTSGITRRELVQRGGLLALPALLRGRVAAAERLGATATPPPPTALPGLRIGSEMYQSIGVRPFVNARGTYTILTGSTMLPESRAAMGEASRHYVHLDELAEAIGEGLAELTQAEWGMVSTGCAAALTHATVACVTGGNPELHVRVPDLRGFPRDECVIPKHWDKTKLGTTGEAVAKLLFETEPRISLFPTQGKAGPDETGLTIGPYMMAPGDEKVVAERLFAVLSSPPRVDESPPAPPATDLTGTWDVRIQYAASASTHRLHVRQRGNDLDGVHQGDFESRDLMGTLDGDAVRLRSSWEHGDSLNYTFTGIVTGDEMAGDVNLGEYLDARFTAKRHAVGGA
jgi:hypothetical protein